MMYMYFINIENISSIYSLDKIHVGLSKTPVIKAQGVTSDYGSWPITILLMENATTVNTIYMWPHNERKQMCSTCYICHKLKVWLKYMTGIVPRNLNLQYMYVILLDLNKIF